MAREGIPINKKLWSAVKSVIKRQYTTWPSAYASGALVKLYKAKGGKFRALKSDER
jgi:hypothetical protein